jgi:uncharacterized protein YjiS (DUF1127 family)
MGRLGTSSSRHLIVPFAFSRSPANALLRATACAASASSVTLLEWHERQGIRASLFDLSDREPHDIGISSGEIDYVASIRSTDPPPIPIAKKPMGYFGVVRGPSVAALLAYFFQWFGRSLGDMLLLVVHLSLPNLRLGPYACRSSGCVHFVWSNLT